MRGDAPYALPLERYEPPALRVLVNFAIITGRVPSQLEVRQLTTEIERLIPTATVVVEQRHEVGTGVDVCLDEVRIEVPDRVVASLDPPVDPAELQERLVQLAGAWVARCVDASGDSLSIAERRARSAVVDAWEPRRDRF